MSRRAPKTLSGEDRVLWSRVARSAVPLKGKALPVEPVPVAAAPDLAPLLEAPSPIEPRVPAARTPPKPAPRALDKPLKDKLGKGRLQLEARVDLHGLTQAEAHRLLHAFLYQAREEGLRHVLVITGKGSSSSGDGVLRRSVPQWFSTAPFRLLVSGFDEASRRHGGGGALYVRLRRAERGLP